MKDVKDIIKSKTTKIIWAVLPIGPHLLSSLVNNNLYIKYYYEYAY